LAGVILAVAIDPLVAAASTEQQQLVDKAKLTVEAFASDPAQKDDIRQSLKDARAVFIVPQLFRGAFLFGGTGGGGVLLARDEKSGEWSQPVFYNMASVSFGLQAGADTSELIIVVRTQKGLEEFYSTDFKLGAEAGLSAGPVAGSTAVEGVAADLLSFGRTRGVFAGMALNGASVKVSDDSNERYYGKSVRPIDVLVTKTVSNPASADLRAAVGKLVNTSSK